MREICSLLFFAYRSLDNMVYFSAKDGDDKVFLKKELSRGLPGKKGHSLLRSASRALI